MFNQLTQKDIDAMEAEIEERKLVIRPKLLEAVKGLSARRFTVLSIPVQKTA